MFAIVAAKKATKQSKKQTVKKVGAKKPPKKIADRGTEVLTRLKVLYPEAICELTHEIACFG